MLQTAEEFLVTLRHLYQELDEDPEDDEWMALYHAFCFLSYNIEDFRKYLEEVVNKD